MPTGGKEASRSNLCLYRIICEAIQPEVPADLIGLVNTREAIDDLLEMHDTIDLVIPRGSNKLVSYIQSNTKIPVMGHADGICHLYVDEAADFDMAKSLMIDSKLDYPSACNAVECILVHSALAKDGRIVEVSIILDSPLSFFLSFFFDCLLDESTCFFFLPENYRLIGISLNKV